jgi:hypothetical protein
MNKQEIEKAIHTLECARLYIFENSNRQDYSLEALDRLSNAVDDAKSALEQQLTNGWIPVSSGRLPEDTDGDDLATVYVCMKFKDSPFGNDDAVYQDVVDFMTDKKIWLIEDDFEVTAWRPRFEPYKEVSE